MRARAWTYVRGIGFFVYFYHTNIDTYIFNDPVDVVEEDRDMDEFLSSGPWKKPGWVPGTPLAGVGA